MNSPEIILIFNPRGSAADPPLMGPSLEIKMSDRLTRSSWRFQPPTWAPITYGSWEPKWDDSGGRREQKDGGKLYLALMVIFSCGLTPGETPHVPQEGAVRLSRGLGKLAVPMMDVTTEG
jgi:hypothetical protein